MNVNLLGHWGLVPRPAAPHRAGLRFGHVSYRDILTRSPAVSLTPQQAQHLNEIETIAQTQHALTIEQMVSVLKTKEYAHLINVAYRNPNPAPHEPRYLTRQRFHTPFTDAFMALSAEGPRQTQLLRRLAKAVVHPVNEHERRNSIGALTDIYFYCLRPGAPQPISSLPLVQEPLKSTLLSLLTRLVQEYQTPLLSRRLLQQELRSKVEDVLKEDWPLISLRALDATQRAMVAEVTPLITTSLPATSRGKEVDPVLAERFKEAIRLGDTAQIQQVLQHPVLKALIPDWERAISPDNYQHSAQDFPLNEHLLRAVRFTRQTAMFATLSPEAQFRVTTAAFFHDIAKRTGPYHFRLTNRITADAHHPERSAEILLHILPALGYTPAEIEDVYTLVRYHQNLGEMAKPDGDLPMPDRLAMIADRLKRPQMLMMLQALTEGDIKSVRENTPARTWFTPDVEARLKDYSGRIAALLP